VSENSKGSEGPTPRVTIEKELESIKKLLILLLLKAGASQDEVGAAVGVNQSSISRMFPEINIKKFSETK
jgi:predicted XRE-type DNA-binding protein